MWPPRLSDRLEDYPQPAGEAAVAELADALG